MQNNFKNSRVPDITYFAERPGAHYEALYLIPFLELTGGTFITDDRLVIDKLKKKYSKEPTISIRFGKKDVLRSINSKVTVYSNFYPRSNSKYNVFFYHGLVDKKGLARVYTFKDQRSFLYRASAVLSMNSIFNPISTRAIIPFKLFRQLVKDRFDLILLPGPALYDLFKGINVLKKGNNKIIGYPRLDPILRSEIDKVKIMKDLKLNPEKKTVLYAPTWHGKLEFNMNSMDVMGADVIQAVKDDINLIVHPHPRSITLNEATKVMEILKKKSMNSNNIRLVDDPFFDNMELMAVADILITDFSSVGIEFFAFDKPVIYLDHIGEAYSDNKLSEIYVRDAGSIVREPKKIRKVLLHTIKNPDEKKNARKKYATYFFGSMDGKAAKRGAAAILDILNK